MRVAVIGGGVAGLAAAHALRHKAEVTLFEAGRHFGGHAHTVDVTLGGVTHGVDTGFLVFNGRTYPRLVELLAELRVATAASDMSFSVQVPGPDGRPGLEWSGSNLNAVFCQRGNLLRPRFWRMLRDLLRFNSLATLMAQAQVDALMRVSLQQFLDTHRFSREFRDWYLLPMLGCIWSCPTAAMLRYPAGSVIRFCHNHGLLQIADRPQWYTVAGGSRAYVARIVDGLADARLGMPVRSVARTDDGVMVLSRRGWEGFDRVVLATHSDQSLSLLSDASREERAALGAVKFQSNRAVLHTDISVLPRDRRAWAAWNYQAGHPGGGRVCLHYLINRLQPLPWREPVIVSLNPVQDIEPRKVIGEYEYAHPVLDAAAVRAQKQLASLQGRGRTWFTGAWTGFGFHEDGLASGQAAATAILARQPIDAVVEATA
ncbi:MAG: FAD-dependent oxidoreductase [Ramlibacter sp.]